MARRWIVALLLSANAMLLGGIGYLKCPNGTEVGHMGATVYFWHTLHFDVFHVNPPLTRLLSGLPVVWSRPNYDWEHYSQRSSDRPEWSLGLAFIKANSSQKARQCFVLARWSLIPFLLLGAYFGYRLSSELYGESSGVVFLILWCFSPALLGWGATICPDALAAAMGLIATYWFRRWIRAPTWSRAAIAGLCLGLLPLTKLTWIVAFGLWPLIWLLWIFPVCARGAGKLAATPPSVRQLLTILILGLYVLNLGYFFDGGFRLLGQYTFASQLFRGGQSTSNRFVGTWLARVPVPLPAEFVRGIDTQRLDLERGEPSYTSGRWHTRGRWYYYLYVALVKMPIGTWCLLLLAGVMTLFGPAHGAAGRDELCSVLLPFGTLFILVSSQTGIAAHPRYVLPSLPFLFVWISKVGRAIRRTHWAITAFVGLAIGWTTVTSLYIYPHSLSYVNEAFGGPGNGPQYLLGSNIDCGQDLFALESWCERHPDARPIRVAYSGSYPLDHTTIPCAGPPPGASNDGAPSEPLSGWYAVSVNSIYSESRQYRYFRHFTPVALAGYSIYIYYFSPEGDEGMRNRD